MKMTLLEIVQDVLSDMDSDEVNSISDTAESEQVAAIVRSTYRSMISNRDWPHLKRAIRLTSPGSLLYPNCLIADDNFTQLTQLQYNKAKLGETQRLYRDVKYLFPDDFLRHINDRNSDLANVDIITTPENIELLIRNDQAPTYFTTFDDRTLWFDSYDVAVDDTMQPSKTIAVGYIVPTWVHTDTATPDLPPEAFAALVEECKTRCFSRFKERNDPTSANESRRQQAWLSRKARKVNGGIRYPSYGRNRVKFNKDATFRNENV